MARRRKDPFRRSRRTSSRKLTGEQQLRRTLMDEAFVGDLKGPRYGFTSSRTGKIDVCVFNAPFAAKHYFDLIVQDDEQFWIDDTHLEIECGVTIKSDHLKQIAEFEMARSEREFFDLSQDYHKRASYMRSHVVHVEAPQEDKRRRNSRRGMILIKTLAQELDIGPKEFRSRLRRLGISKPSKGWAWQTRSEANQIKAMVANNTRKVLSIDFSKARKP